jgi:FACT complex subunit SPT16
VNSILVVVGQSDEENPYQKSTSLHVLDNGGWADIVVVVVWIRVSWDDNVTYLGENLLCNECREGYTAYATLIPGKHLDTLVTKDGIPLEILKRTKDEETNKKTFATVIDAIKSAGKKVGVLAKDKFQGKFMAEWGDAYKSAKSDLEEIDVSAGIAMALSVKDEEEQVYPLSSVTD